MGVLRAQTSVLQALSYVDVQLAKAAFNGPIRERLEEDVEGAVTKPLTLALRALLQVLLNIVDQANTRGDVIALEGCLKLLGDLSGKYDAAHAFLIEFNCAKVLESVIQTHPEQNGIVNQALWAQAQILGASAVASILCDPKLSLLNIPVRAAIHILSHLPQCKYADLESALAWRDRWQMAQVVVTAMARYKDDIHMISSGCSALGSLLVSWGPDVVHSESAKVLPVVFDAMRINVDNELLQTNAVYALSSIVQGNAYAVAYLRQEQNEIVLAHVLEKHVESKRIRQGLMQVVILLEGVRGLLSAMGKYDHQGMHNDILWTMANCPSDDGDDEVINADAIEHVVSVAKRWGVDVMMNAVAAMKKLLLMLLGSRASPSSTRGQPQLVNVGEKAVAFLVEVLRDESSTAALRSIACEGLAGAAQQNSGVRSFLLDSSHCLEFLARWQPSERLNVKETTNILLLAGVLQNSVDPVLQAMAVSPKKQGLQQAACSALVQLAIADEDEPQNLVRNEAARVSHSASTALANEPYPWLSLRVAVVGVLGKTLGAIRKNDCPEATIVITQGCEDLLNTLRYLHQRTLPQRVTDARSSDICYALQALNAVVEESPAARAVLTRPETGIVELLADITRNMAMYANSLMLTEALLALGLLGGVRLVCEAMCAFRHAYWFQVAAVMALNSLARLGSFTGVPESELAFATSSVQQATEAFKHRENGALHSQAVITLKLIEVASKQV